jgi:uncharacterized protein YkwD
VPIGLSNNFWVKIIVGSGGATLPTNVPGATLPAVGWTKTVNHCTVSENGGYVNQLLDLINTARREAHIPALVLNPQLTAAAQDHSADMACNNFLSHTGSDGSYIDDRILTAGYAPTYWLEIIAMGTPQDAMNQWQANATHWEAVLDSKATEIGIGYAYYEQSDYGSYITVDLGNR